MSPRIGIVGCSSQKASRACPARDLYTSQLFRSARAYVEANCERWYILSALHGVLDPGAVVAPYDVKLGAQDVEAWGLRVGTQLDGLVPELDAELVVLAGATYADAIATPYDDPRGYREFAWSEPLRGLSVGQRLRWLKLNERRAA